MKYKKYLSIKAQFKKKLTGEGVIYKKGVANLELGGQSRSDYGTIFVKKSHPT